MSEGRKVVTGGIHSFLFEILRASKTSLHYTVRQSPHGYVIEHHWGRWRVYVDDLGARVESDDGHVLTVTRDILLLDGERAEEICAPGYRCFTARDVLQLVVHSIALWYWHLSDPHALRLFNRLLVGNA
jgi:hypothetical protein